MYRYSHVQLPKESPEPYGEHFVGDWSATRVTLTDR